MSQKHFIAIAADIRAQIEFQRDCRDKIGDPHASDCIDALSDLAFRLAKTFKEFNSNFKQDKFIAACGIVTANGS